MCTAGTADVHCWHGRCALLARQVGVPHSATRHGRQELLLLQVERAGTGIVSQAGATLTGSEGQVEVPELNSSLPLSWQWHLKGTSPALWFCWGWGGSKQGTSFTSRSCFCRGLRPLSRVLQLLEVSTVDPQLQLPQFCPHLSSCPASSSAVVLFFPSAVPACQEGGLQAKLCSIKLMFLTQPLESTSTGSKASAGRGGRTSAAPAAWSGANWHNPFVGEGQLQPYLRWVV